MRDATSAQLPEWSKIVQANDSWRWHDHQLVEKNANYLAHSSPKRNGPLARFIVSHVHGRQNRSANVKRVIASALASLKPGQYGLNFGSGFVRIAPFVLNLDIARMPVTDLVSAGGLLTPFKDNSLGLIISQEVLEHVRDPHAAIAEFHRILTSDGLLVLQLPFMIGYHPGPEDLWRFSKEAYAQLLPSDRWKIESQSITVGHGTGFHRILTEFAAVHFSIFGNKFYRAAKGFFSLLFFPFVLFDIATPYLPEKDRIPGGYIVTVKPLK